MTITNFEDFEIWKLSMELLEDIHKLIKTWEFTKDFGFKYQIRRATLSISSNIAEGFEKNNNTEFIRYLTIAKWSCGEVRSQLLWAERIKYISPQESKPLISFCFDLSKRIGGFVQYLKQKKQNWEFKKK